MDDGELAAWFATGDPEATRAVYRAYGSLVYSVAYKVLGNSGLAEDASQQAFLQAWRAAGTFDPTRALAAWLASIARRTAIDVYRRERRHLGARDIDDVESELTTMPPSVEQIYDVSEVRHAVDALPDEDRKLIRMQHFDELTHNEIAQRLEIPVGTVKSRSFRAHRRLAGLLGHLAPHIDLTGSPTSAGEERSR
ncbi:MAG: RNA polymerase sigma factor [Actinomycetales bacterium]